MPRTPRAPVHPPTLRSAREEAAVDPEDAAGKLRIPQERLLKWEHGTEQPTLRQLKTLATLYSRPPAYFFASSPTRREHPEPTDFRAHETAEEHPATIRRHILRALERRESFFELLPNDPTPLALAFPALDEPLQQPQAVRSALAVSEERQQRAPDAYASLRLWIDAIERFQVLVFQSSDLGASNIRGLSIFFERVPIIYLRGSDAPAGRVFTVLHELGHLLARSSGLCDPYDPADQRLEQRCNAFAADILMPEGNFRAAVNTALYGRSKIDATEALARQFGVSIEAAAVRMVALNIAEQELIDTARQRTREYLQQRTERTGFAPYPRKRLRDLGRLYVGTVFEAVEEEQIGLTEALQHLDVKSSTYERMKQQLGPSSETEPTVSPSADPGVG
jgi:Zn-dependent peptidase ImmA (M78 family)